MQKGFAYDMAGHPWDMSDALKRNSQSKIIAGNNLWLFRCSRYAMLKFS